MGVMLQYTSIIFYLNSNPLSLIVLVLLITLTTKVFTTLYIHKMKQTLEKHWLFNISAILSLSHGLTKKNKIRCTIKLYIKVLENIEDDSIVVIYWRIIIVAFIILCCLKIVILLCCITIIIIIIIIIII